MATGFKIPILWVTGKRKERRPFALVADTSVSLTYDLLNRKLVVISPDAGGAAATSQRRMTGMGL